MKKKQWLVVGFLAALLAASPAVGQSSEIATIADIPFAFTVANLTLPPGRYTVTRWGDRFVRIGNSQRHGTFALTVRMEGKARDSSKMVFHRYGNAYFLSEIWVAGSTIGAGVFRSQSEKELAGQRTEMEIAELKIVPIAN